MDRIVLFSAHLYRIRPIWIFAPMALYLLCFLLSFPLKSRLDFIRSKKTLKFFALVQVLALSGHIYAFATELLPYYFHHYDVVEGKVEDFAGPTNPYNRAESFSVNGVAFQYNHNALTFGYHDTTLDDGVIHADMKNIRVTYVHNPFNDENIILRLESIPPAPEK